MAEGTDFCETGDPRSGAELMISASKRAYYAYQNIAECLAVSIQQKLEQQTEEPEDPLEIQAFRLYQRYLEARQRDNPHINYEARP